MSTHNICFYKDLAKIIFQLSSNMHIISSSVYGELVKLSINPHKTHTTEIFVISMQTAKLMIKLSHLF